MKPRRHARPLATILLLIVATPAAAVDYRFPVADEHYAAFYPTAYMDEGGHDWACGDIYYDGHTGSDFGGGSWTGMDAGRNIVAAADGVVVASNDGEWDRCSSGDCGEANYVILEHADGRRTLYWHLKQWTVAVSVGQTVTCGTYLGQMGSSGYSFGPHLHFGVQESNRSNGDPFDGPCSAPPTYWIDQGEHGGLPGNACPNVGPCTHAATLSCGQTLSAANNAAGSTSTHGVYGCGSASSGPEIAYAFSTDVSESVTIGLAGVSADLDMFLLANTECDGNGALTCSTNPDASDEWITFDATAGVTYTIVVDGWAGAVSGFNLSALCTGGSGGAGGDTAVVVDTADDTGSSPTHDTEVTGNDDGTVAVPGRFVSLPEAGCGCGGEGDEEEDGGAPDAEPEKGGVPGTLVPLGSAVFVGLGALARRRRRHAP